MTKMITNDINIEKNREVSSVNLKRTYPKTINLRDVKKPTSIIARQYLLILNRLKLVLHNISILPATIALIKVVSELSAKNINPKIVAKIVSNSQ
jgi:hypothetical protein